VRKLQVKFIEGVKTQNNEECFPEEFTGLEDVLFIKQQESVEDEKKRSRSREKERKEHKKKKRSRSRNKDKKEEEELMDEVLKKERERASAHTKDDYAKRPASYKSALSLALPVGTTRKKEGKKHREREEE